MNKNTWLVGIGCVLFAAGSLTAGELKTDTRTIALEGAKKLEIKCTFAAGRLNIEPASISEAARIDAEYDPDRIDLDVDYRVRGDAGRLTIETDHHGRNIDTDDNYLDLTLSDKLPTDLRMELGACKSELELGGVPLTLLDLEIGAASGTIAFSKPNPVRMRRMNVEVGASSAKLYKVGNANVDRVKCSIGAASSHIDLTGEYHGETEVEISVGVASAEVVLPSNVPVRVEADDDNWFSSVKFRKRDLDKIDDGVWESPEFENAKDRLIVRIEVGMGSVKVTWE
jgi:hypothetical protein